MATENRVSLGSFLNNGGLLNKTTSSEDLQVLPDTGELAFRLWRGMVPDSFGASQ
jgi:hypothetical protein